MSGEGGAGPAWRRWLLRLVVGASVSGAIVAALLTQVDVARVGEVLVGAEPSWIALGLAVYSVLGGIRAWRVRLLLPDVPLASLYAITNMHLLLLRLLPMRTGELGFAWLMRRSGRAGFAQSLVGLLLLRVLDLATVLVLYALALLASRGDGRASALAIVAALAIATTMLALAVRPLLRAGQSIGERVLALARLDRVARIARARDAMAGAVRWSNELPSRVLWRATALTLVQWLVSFAFTFVLARAMRLDVTPWEAVLGGTGSIVGSMLPIPGIGTFGALEAGWAGGFALVGVPADLAIASAFGFSVISLVYSAILALATLSWLAPPRAAD